MSLQRWCFNFHLLLIVLTLSISTNALPLPSQPSDGPPYRNGHPNWGCSFSGNSDLYGLGIRLGVYLQLLSTLLANTFLSEELREDARNTNAIIMIAVFAGMASATVKNQINAVEIFIMTTLLMSFLWSDFTPDHISNLVLFNHSKIMPVRTILSRRIPKVPSPEFSDSNSNSTSEEKSIGDGEEKGEVESKRYFAAISRSIFGTAIAIFNVWFWLYSRHTLLKNGINDPKCIPIVFLETQIELGNNDALFYVILSIIYAVYEVLFMGWWVYVLAPATLRLLYELFMIGSASVCGCKCARAEVSVKEKVAKWYLNFARLDHGALKIFTQIQVSRENQERLWGLRLYVPLIITYVIHILRRLTDFIGARNFVVWFGLPAGYIVMVYASLAVELTLAWNEVSGVYVLGSTGQLIPFVVGLLGMVRNLHLIAVKLSEKAHKRKEEKEIKVEWDTGAYVYGFGTEKELKLEATMPKRRRSIDSGLVDLGKERDNVGLSRQSTSVRSYSWKTE